MHAASAPHPTPGPAVPSPLRIAVFHDLPSGGAKRALRAQVAELARRGHRVDAFVTSVADREFLPVADVAHAVHTVPLPDPPDRERILAGRPTPADLAGWISLYRALAPAAREVAHQVEDGGYDVALVHPSQFTQAPHVLRYARLPTVYYCHEPLRAAYEPLISPAPVRLAIRLTLGRVDRRNARAATAIAANSRFTAAQVRRIYGRDAEVAPPGVDTDTFRPTPGPRGDYLLAVGALHPLKGIPFILEAVGRLPDPPPLVLVSDRFRARERERIEERASTLGIDLDIRQRVPESELVRLYGRARVVLAAPHREPLGLVPLEAMACGTPVVAVAEGGLTETVADGVTGWLAAREPGDFAGRVHDLLADPAGADAMGARGRDLVEAEWGWGRSVDRLLGILRSAAGAAAS